MNSDVQHYLGVYMIRKSMQEEAITNPSNSIEGFTREFVEKLKQIPPEEEIVIRENSYYDSKDNLIATIPLEL